MPQNSTSSAPHAGTTVFRDDVLAKAAVIAADAYRPVWVGPSGEESSGESVALHLEATVELLEMHGWSRTHAVDPAADLPDDDTMTVEEMVRALLQFIREDCSPVTSRTLASAVNHIGVVGEHGDPDTASIGSGVMDFIIQAHTGSVTAHATPWSERAHRTLADVTALLNASAQFARLHGPAGQEPVAA